MRLYLLAQLEASVNPCLETEANLKLQFALVVGQTKPINLREGPQNAMTVMEKSWDKLCATLRECDCPNPERFSVFQLYIQLEHLEEKFENQKKQMTKNGRK